MSAQSLAVTLIGFGAIGRALHTRLAKSAQIKIAQVVVPAEEIPAAQLLLGDTVDVRMDVPPDAALVVECAGHGALLAHVVPALARGIECAVLSIGALAEIGLIEKLQAAAKRGNTQVHLLSGAIGGIDAIAAAKYAGLTRVTYIDRKPPAGWRGTAAEAIVDLESIAHATTFFNGTAREAAQRYPKNANVAATISLAGLGLDATAVKLIADPTITENIHAVEVEGAFGTMKLSMVNQPLAENPKTSAQTVLSVLRFLHNRVAPVTL